MRPRDIVDIVLLGAIWGGAFPLMRFAVPSFGPVPLVTVRVAIASVVLLAIAKHRRQILSRAGVMFVLGLINTAIPFALFSYSTLSITAGLASLLNATTPMFGALIAFFWLGERLTWSRVLGIVLAFCGVSMLVWDTVGTKSSGALWGIAAALGGAALYGLAASFARRRLRDADPSAIAAGTVVGATLALVPLAVVQWPVRNPPASAWVAALALGLACTALAYAIYFRLLRNVGPSRAVTVTFLIPAFGICWGALFLREPITAGLIAGCIVILIGTALATGVVRLGRR